MCASQKVSIFMFTIKVNAGVIIRMAMYIV